MGSEGEAAGEVLTGSIVAHTIEQETNRAAAHDENADRGTCLNCGATLTNPFCAACGQPARIHRSLLSLGHDILHGVFHFEGKIWRTMPALLFHPGRLTRRYIDGERAKFVSPMALYLFIVFLMFAVFSFTGGVQFGSKGIDPLGIGAEWQAGNAAALETTDRGIHVLREELAAPDLSAERRDAIDREIAELQAARDVMQALAEGDLAGISKIKAREAQQNENDATTGIWPAPDSKLGIAIQQVKSNPSLMRYKIKTNAYKFFWALVPLSVPFLWVLFFWRRDIRVYDHAIFATYSISFMMLLFLLCSLAAMAGLSAFIWGTTLALVPPIHLYKQLRGAYGLSRAGAALRLFFLLISMLVVLVLFVSILFLLGAFS